MIGATLFVSVVYAAVALVNWRYGILGLFAIAVLQDIFRKLTPGAPPSFILWSGAMFALLLIIAYLKGAIRGLRPIYLADHRLSLAWTLFFLVVLLQAMHSFLRWGNPMVSLLGIAFYLGPIAALLMGLAYARSQRWIERFLIGYVLIIAPAALSTYLSLHFSEQWAILRDIGTFTGTHLIIYDQGTIMFSHPGVFRVGELAGWHAMTSIAFLSVLAIRRRSFFLRLLIGILVIALVGAIMLTGRRKMLMTVLIFFAFQSVILILLKKGFNRVTGTILIMVTATTLATDRKSKPP